MWIYLPEWFAKYGGVWVRLASGLFAFMLACTIDVIMRAIFGDDDSAAYDDKKGKEVHFPGDREEKQ